MNAEEQYEERTLWTILGPTVYNIVAWVMYASFIGAGLAILYLLFGLFSGNLNGVTSLPPDGQNQVMSVVGSASTLLLWGVAVGTLSAALVLWTEEATGYIILAAAAVLAFGVPFALSTFGGQNQSGKAVELALLGFRNAAFVPGIIGGVMVAIDVGKRFVNAFQSKAVAPETFTYGADASEEPKPRRTSILGKCWEGPYCRDSIRPHCPIFQERKACWKERRGCYCEEDIVTRAAEKVQGIVLGMAPDPQRNFANAPTPGTPMGGVGGAMGQRNPELTIGGRGIVSLNQEFGSRRIELTMAEKVERCRNCVIYNEHQKEKYKIFMPLAIVGGLLLCVVFSTVLRDLIGNGFAWADSFLAHISFKPGEQGNQTFGKPNGTVAWVMVVALSLMFVSKLLQVVEWACFKAKI